MGKGKSKTRFLSAGAESVTHRAHGTSLNEFEKEVDPYELVD